MKYAVIQLGGKQFRVSEGDSFKIERQEKLNIDVLLYSDGKEITVGKPFVNGIKVNAEIKDNKLDKKVKVARYKSKSRYRKNKGHRQPISIVKINYIGAAGAAKVAKTSEKKADVKVEKKVTAKKSPIVKKAPAKAAKAKRVAKKGEK